MTRRYPISPVPRYTLGDIITVVIACIVTVTAFMALLALFLISVKPAHATYKPEYAKNPPAVQEWFGAQKIMPAAGIGHRIGCDQNLRFDLLEAVDDGGCGHVRRPVPR